MDAIAQVVAGDAPETVWLGTGGLGLLNFDLTYHTSKSPDYYHRDARNYYFIENRLAMFGNSSGIRR